MLCNPDRTQEYIRSILYSLEKHHIGEELWIFLSAALMLFVVIFILIFNRDKEQPLFTTIYFITGILAILIIQIPNFARYAVHVNECQHIAEAILLSRDFLFWKSVDGTTIGPWPIYLLSLIHKTGIPIDYFTVKIINIGLWIVTTIIVYKIFRVNFSPFYARLFILPVFMLIALLDHRDLIGYNGEVLTNIFLLLSFYLILRSPFLKSKLWMRLDYFIIGLLLVLAPFSKFQAGPIAFLLGLYFFYHLIRQKRAYSYLILGVSIPLTALIIYLYKFDLFYDFWQSYILNNIYYANNGEGLNNNKGLILRFAKFILIFLKAPELRLYFLISFIFIGYFIFYIVQKQGILRAAKNLFSDFNYTLIFIYLMASLFVVYVPGNVFLHYAIFALIPLHITCAYLVHNYKNFVPGLVNKYSYVLFLVFLPSINTIFGGNTAFSSITERTHQETQGLIVQYLCRESEKNDRLAIWGWESSLYSDTNLLMGTRESQTQRQILSWKQQKYYLKRYLSDLTTYRPRFFIDTTKKDSHLLNYDRDNFTNFDDIRNFIYKNYTYVLEDDGMILYELKKFH